LTPKRARMALGLTRESAAKRLRISARTLARYEAGSGKSLYLARRIARLYGMSVFAAFSAQGRAASTWNAELVAQGLLLEAAT